MGSALCKPKRIDCFRIATSATRIESAAGANSTTTAQLQGAAAQEPQINEDAFHVCHLIDTGGFGFVFKATRKGLRPEATYALKVQPMEFMAKLSRAGGTRAVNKKSLQIERNTLVECKGHPFIVRLEYAFCTPLYAVLAMEYIPGGTLSRLITSSVTLPSKIAKIYTAEIALALNYMHNKGIIYRDVKPSNVLICLDGHIKITDFGLAGSLIAKKKQVNPQESVLESTSSSNENGIDQPTDEDEDSMSSEDYVDDDARGDLRRIRRRTLCGTAGFRPPEQVGERYVDYFSRSGYDEKADYFSLGVTLFAMVAGRRPFPSKKEMMQSYGSETGVSSPSRRRSSRTGTNVSNIERPSSAIERALIRRTMRDVEFRCLMSEVVYPEHLEQNGKELIESLLEKDPDRRPDFDGIKLHPWMSDVEFSPLILKGITMPDWLIQHAAVEANPKTIRRSSMTSNRIQKKHLTLSLFIQDMCTQMIDIGNKVEGESAAARWMTDPSTKTVDLFQGWDYISEEAKSIEINGNLGFINRLRSRRETSQW